MQYKKITSTSNPIIKEAVKEKKGRLQNHLLIEGHRLVEMAVASGAEIARVFFTADYKSKHAIFLRQISKKASELIETSEHIITKLSDTETPQGIAATIHYRPRRLKDLNLKADPLIVVIDGIQDPGNLGTIIRTSDAAGADAVIILPATCDVFMPKVIRATAGSIFNIAVVHSETGALIRWLKEKNISLYAADVKASETIYETDMCAPIAFAFGSEAHGVSEVLKKSAGTLLKIPIAGKAESLNVAISAAICLYEVLRQRTALY